MEGSEFEQVTYQFERGDTFYFITDGISDLVNEEITNNLYNFDHCYNYILRKTSANLKDDASAICVKII